MYGALNTEGKQFGRSITILKFFLHLYLNVLVTI